MEQKMSLPVRNITIFEISINQQILTFTLHVQPSQKSSHFKSYFGAILHYNGFHLHFHQNADHGQQQQVSTVNTNSPQFVKIKFWLPFFSSFSFVDID